ncbi:hypothetical protein [Stenotrophomonas maltophilia]|uniref:hypothetical protein n=1 Tax=Stenotrophomonas maltophilia TaxID=40324 RepID=UPI0015DF8D09|nr:hypothetical protein [Stenotrophomonas maltophilia]
MDHNEHSRRDAASRVEPAAPVRPVGLIVAATLTAVIALLAGVNSLFVPFAPPHLLGGAAVVSAAVTFVLSRKVGR